MFCGSENINALFLRTYPFSCLQLWTFSYDLVICDVFFVYVCHVFILFFNEVLISF